MATVLYSLDGGATWETPIGDPWPTTAGRHIVRLEFRDAPLSRRVMLLIQSTDADAWQVRSIVLKGVKIPQEVSLGTPTAITVSPVILRRFSQESEPTIEVGELAAWRQPSTGRVWLLYRDTAKGNIMVEVN